MQKNALATLPLSVLVHIRDVYSQLAYTNERTTLPLAY